LIQELVIAKIAQFSNMLRFAKLGCPAADDLGIESRALVDVAHRNAEMRDTLDLGHEFLLHSHPIAGGGIAS
jgi:hypothetical protein